MANSLGDMIFRIGANIDGFEKSMGTVSQRLKAIDGQAAKAFGGFQTIGNRLKDVGTAITGSLTIPLGAVSVGALKAAGDFEHSMNKVKGFGDITGQSLEKLRLQALKLGADTEFSAQQAADGMAAFSSAGMTADEIYKAMPGTLSLAAAGQMAVGEAAGFVSDVLGQFGLKAEDTTRIADVMAQSLKDTKATMEEMSTTLTYVGPVAKGAGLSLEETTAAIIALDVAGIRGEKAGTGLRGVIASLLSPSKDAAEKLAALGISVEGTDGKMRPLSDIMEQFKTKLGTVKSEVEANNLIFQIFGREAGNAAQVLINTGGPALDAYEQKLLGSEGAAKTLAETINSGLNFRLEQFKGSVETAGIALGTALIPVANKLLELLTNIVNNGVMPAVEWFSKLPEPVQTGAIAIAAIAAATGPLLIAFGVVLSSIGSIGAAMTTAAGIFTSFGTVAVPSAATAIKAFATTTLPNVATSITTFGNGSLAGLVNKFGDFAKNAIPNAGAAIRTFGSETIPGAITSIENLAVNVLPKLTLALNTVGTAAGVVVAAFVVWEGLKEIWASAGSIATELRTATEGLGDKLLWLGSTALDAAISPFKKLIALALPFPETIAKITAKVKELKDDALQPVIDAFNLWADVIKPSTDQLGKLSLAAIAARTRLHAVSLPLGILRDLFAQIDKTLKTFNGTAEGTIDAQAALKRVTDSNAQAMRNAISGIKTFGNATEGVKNKSKDGEKAQKDLGKAVKETAAEHRLAVDHVRKFQDGVPAESIADYERKLRAARLELAKTSLEHQVAVLAGKDFQGQLEKNIDAAQLLATEWSLQSKVKMPEYVAGIGKISDAAKGLPATMAESLEQGGYEFGKYTGKATETAAKVKGTFGDLGKDVSTIFTNTAQSIARDFFDGNLSVGEKFEKMAQDMGEAVLAKFIEPATTAIGTFISDVIGNLLSGKGLGGVIDSLKEIGSAIGKVFGIGGGAVSTAANTATTAAGGAGDLGSAAGSAAGAVGSGLAGIVGAVGSVVSAISGVIGNFQFMAMNKSLDLIEKEVRFSQIHLFYMLEKANEFWPYMKGCWESLVRMEARAIKIEGEGGSEASSTNTDVAVTDAAAQVVMRRVEENTRYLRGWFGEQSQNALWCLQTLVERSGYAVSDLNEIARYGFEHLLQLDRISRSIETLVVAPVGAAAGGMNIRISNNTFTSRGDIDYVLEGLSKRLREAGAKI